MILAPKYIQSNYQPSSALLTKEEKKKREDFFFPLCVFVWKEDGHVLKRELSDLMRE